MFNIWGLTQCVSTPFVTECPQRDWFELGRQDGSQGRTLKTFDNHLAQCGSSENPPNEVLYVNGRNSGLIGYCQASSGFEVGRSGERYNSVCPDYLEQEFIEAFKKGRKILELQLAKAEVEIESSKFNLALESLNNFENRFPNFKKKDKYYFLLAKANFYLKNYDTSLENLKVLFLDYPKSDVILEGKFLEAKAFEKTQATQKAIDIYKDIIQSAPNKHAVQNARLAIKRLQAMQK